MAACPQERCPAGHYYLGHSDYDSTNAGQCPVWSGRRGYYKDTPAGRRCSCQPVACAITVYNTATCPDEHATALPCRCAGFRGTVSSWDVSGVTSMRKTFHNAASFLADLARWDLSSATTTEQMFDGARVFDSEIGKWDVGRVLSMRGMFRGAAAFNKTIGGWSAAACTDMSEMFKGAVSFSSVLDGWDVSNVLNMAEMFANATSFAQSISAWDVGRVVDFDRMIAGASKFAALAPPLRLFGGSTQALNVLLELARDVGDAAKLFGADCVARASCGAPLTSVGIRRAVILACAQDPAVFGAWDTALVTDAEGLFSAPPVGCKTEVHAATRGVSGSLPGRLYCGILSHTCLPWLWRAEGSQWGQVRLRLYACGTGCGGWANAADGPCSTCANHARLQSKRARVPTHSALGMQDTRFGGAR